jgi:signal transduction histidine kinase
LKTPLTVISGYTGLLVQEDDEEKRRELAASVKRQVQLLTTMMGETLAFAKGERRILIRRVYLHKFFEDLADQLKPELSQQGIRLELVLRDRGVAHFDEEKIQRVFYNLARNAAEAIGKEGGVCRLEVDRSDDGNLVLTFSDDGPGISEEIRGRLFESFTTHGKKGGTGLGLAIVQSIVEDHGGSVSVDSEPGRTSFMIVLPQPQPRASLRPEAAE